MTKSIFYFETHRDYSLLKSSLWYDKWADLEREEKCEKWQGDISQEKKKDDDTHPPLIVSSNHQTMVVVVVIVVIKSSRNVWFVSLEATMLTLGASLRKKQSNGDCTKKAHMMRLEARRRERTCHSVKGPRIFAKSKLMDSRRFLSALFFFTQFYYWISNFWLDF